MKRKSSRRLVRWLGLAIAVAAFAAPAAQAMPVISNEGGMAAAPHVLYADDLHASLPRPVSTQPLTDSLGRPLGQPDVQPASEVSAAPQVLYADDLHASLSRPISTQPLTDSLGRPLGPPDAVQPVGNVASASTGFDWNDAGIGAVSVFGLMLLGIGVLLVGRHNRRSRLAAI